ncbi:hypothetical protein SCLCIDRAFT_123341, partial [Scleroderma citrinum Foug A]
YGEKGSAIIQHTLMALFPLSLGLAVTLCPPSHSQFLTYFMVPHVAALLIAKDYDYTTVPKSHKIMVASSDAGAFVHPADDDDDELEEIYQKTIIAFRLNQLEILMCEEDGTQDTAQALLTLQGKKAFCVP